MVITEKPFATNGSLSHTYGVVVDQRELSRQNARVNPTLELLIFEHVKFDSYWGSCGFSGNIFAPKHARSPHFETLDIGNPIEN